MPSFGRQITLFAESAPDATALIHVAPDGSETTIPWSVLEQRSNQVARLLGEHGVEQGGLVAVALPNIPEHFYACYGAWKCGATVLPLRWDLPVWERDRLLALAKPNAIVANWHDAPPAMVSMAELAASTSLDATALDDRVAEPAQAIATSGSTGTPKLIVAPGRGETADNMSFGPAQELAQDAKQLVVSPLYHTNGFVCHLWLQSGKPIVVMERFDAERVVDVIERHRVKYAIMVPTMLQRIARVPDVEQRDFTSMDSVLYGAAPIADWVVRVWFRLIGPERFFFSYGGTERFGLCMCSGVEWLEHPGTVGLPQGCEVRILDEQGNELPPGEVGEIFMRSITMGAPAEYVGAPPARSTEDGFRSYGDMGWLDDDGYVFIADRRVDMIVSGGANVWPAEIEAALSEYPGVRDSVVIGVADPDWGRRVHAIVEPGDPANPPREDELRAFCRERLTSYKVPKTFEIADRALRSAAGKVNRSALVSEREEASPETC